MAEWITVRKASGQGPALRVKWCASPACRALGLMFRRELGLDEGLLLVGKAASRSGAAIHMWFVFMPLAVFWLDAQGKVVGKVLAKPWRVYHPPQPAQHVLETCAERLDAFQVGDTLEFVRGG
jgi:uncharacterized membrane protein (UPF0127 family)